MNNRWTLFVAVLCVCALVLVACSLTLFPGLVGYRTFRMPSSDMAPTLMTGDHFVADMRCYRSRPPERGDIIIFPYPRDRSKRFAKRVVGIAGDTIEVRGKNVILNGKELGEPYARYLDEKSLDASSLQATRFDIPPTKVPPASLFVMGDNRDRTTDSRLFGSIPVADAEGKVLLIYWNPDELSRIGKTF